MSISIPAELQSSIGSGKMKVASIEVAELPLSAQTTTSEAEDPKVTPYQYTNQYMGKPRPLRMVVIGAGVSGICTTHLFREKCAGKGVELAIYEKNHDVGGTWLENRYPGCACDVLSHIYQPSWEHHSQWSRAYAGAEEIWNMYKNLSEKYQISEFLHLKHRVIGATWNESEGKWTIKVEQLDTGIVFEDKAEILMNAGGYVNKWKWPDVKGLETFAGKKMHSANWDQDFIFDESKKIAVIGSGSSAIQIVPQLQKKVKHLTSFIRSKVWITPEWSGDFAPEGRTHRYTDEEKEFWASNPDEFFKHRKVVEADMNEIIDLMYKDSDMQKQVLEIAKKILRERLAAKPGLADRLQPGFDVGCKRVTPGTGFLEALASENVDVRTDPIEEILPEGIKMKNGDIIHIDTLVCATGFDSSYRPAFPVIGRNGVDLRDQWKDDPASYLSIAAHGFPNYFIIGGPNMPISNGTLLGALEIGIQYVFQVIEKMQREGIKALDPKQEAVDDFIEHKDAVMQDTVWKSSCRSWYKNSKIDGAVWGPWPGSSLQYMELMEVPRWEDYDIQYISRNRFQFLGYGKAEREVNGGDLAYYVTRSSAPVEKDTKRIS